MTQGRGDRSWDVAAIASAEWSQVSPEMFPNAVVLFLSGEKRDFLG